MGTISVEALEARLLEIDNDLKSMAHDYAVMAAASQRAERARELAIAEAYVRAEGSPTDRRQAALKAVGSEGVETLAAYAHAHAAFSVARERGMIGASLLKAALSGRRPREDRPPAHDYEIIGTERQNKAKVG